MFKYKASKKPDDVAILVVERNANISKIDLENAFGSTVLIIYTDSHVLNGVEYIGKRD